jgi:hypothetical protein
MWESVCVRYAQRAFRCLKVGVMSFSYDCRPKEQRGLKVDRSRAKDES